MRYATARLGFSNCSLPEAGKRECKRVRLLQSCDFMHTFSSLSLVFTDPCV